jgi:hypothetical protein
LQVLEKLDGEGCSRVANVLRGLQYDSVLVVGQANSFVEETFQAVDTVVKVGGRAKVVLNSMEFEKFKQAVGGRE